MKDLIVNELSIDGQFNSIEEFENNLRESFKLFELQKILEKNLYFCSSIYRRNITNNTTISTYLASSHSDEVRKLRSYLMQNFWDINPIHNNCSIYKCDYTELIYGYSIAEACERQCNIFSFNHQNYLLTNIVVWKDLEEFLIENYTNEKDFINNKFELIVNILWQKLNIDFEKYFRLLLRIFAIKQLFTFINEYELNDKFKEKLLSIPVHIRNKTITQIAKRLSLNRDEANLSESLNDEPIRGNPNLRRFYITKNLGRIHYVIHNNSIVFESVNIQHDEGLS